MCPNQMAGFLCLRHYLIRRSSYDGGCLSKSSSCGLPIKSTRTEDTSLQVLKSLEKNNNTMNCHELEQIVLVDRSGRRSETLSNNSKRTIISHAHAFELWGAIVLSHSQ